MRDESAQTRSGRRHTLLAPEVSASRTSHNLIRAAETRSFQPHGGTRLQYGDVGIFFISVLALALACRLAVHLHLLSQAKLLAPPLTLQIVISLSLLAALYLIVRVRHGRGVWVLLGWRRPTREYLLVALIGGVGLAICTDVVARASSPASHLIRFWDLLVLGTVLGPLLEESFFRGCLLPVLAHTAGPKLAILGAAVLFATFHQVTSLAQWVCFVGTGMAYGWIKTKSGSTAAAATMHAAYNLALFFCQLH
jgi:membrane protease YdiL (CAAX protease family)